MAGGGSSGGVKANGPRNGGGGGPRGGVGTYKNLPINNSYSFAENTSTTGGLSMQNTSQFTSNQGFWDRLIFGSNDSNLQIATFEDNPVSYFMGGAGVKIAKEAVGSSKIYEVYKLINIETKSVEYIGKTSRGFMTRFSEHLVDPLKQEWINSVKPVLYKGNLTKYGAKYYEQSLILKYKLQNLRNIINGVAEKYWSNYGLRK